MKYMQDLRLTIIFFLVLSPDAIGFAKRLGDVLPCEPLSLSHPLRETSLTSVFDRLFVLP